MGIHKLLIKVDHPQVESQQTPNLFGCKFLVEKAVGIGSNNQNQRSRKNLS